MKQIHSINSTISSNVTSLTLSNKSGKCNTKVGNSSSVRHSVYGMMRHDRFTCSQPNR